MSHHSLEINPGLLGILIKSDVEKSEACFAHQVGDASFLHIVIKTLREKNTPIFIDSVFLCEVGAITR